LGLKIYHLATLPSTRACRTNPQLAPNWSILHFTIGHITLTSQSGLNISRKKLEKIFVVFGGLQKFGKLIPSPGWQWLNFRHKRREAEICYYFWPMPLFLFDNTQKCVLCMCVN
jgi:hypothetical protein